MHGDPSSQRELAQFYQQRRIEELQNLRQQQAHQEAMNQNRFIQMRNQFLASTSPVGQQLDLNNAGFFGRGIGHSASGAPSRQGILGNIIDANALRFRGAEMFGINPFYRAGFQIGDSLQAVQERARQTQSVFRANITKVAADAILPDFASRAFYEVGFGDIQQNSLVIADALAGARGLNSDNLSGRGVSFTKAAQIQEDLQSQLNVAYGNRLSTEEVASLSSIAGRTLTSEQRELLASGSDQSISKVNKEQIDLLKTIARNSGLTVENLDKVATHNQQLGNTLTNLESSSALIARNQVSTDVSREVQLSTAAQFTAQGRSLGIADAQAFGNNQLNSVFDLVNDFNNQIIDRSELYRFGGSTDFEAATRVRQRQLQQGQQFAGRESRLLGVLGTRAQSSLNAGFQQNVQDIAGEFAADPFAGLKARFNFGTNQNLITNSGQLALQQAKNRARTVAGADQDAVDALTKKFFGEATGRSDLDAAKEVDILNAQLGRVSRTVENFAGENNLSDSEAARLERELTNKVLPTVTGQLGDIESSGLTDNILNAVHGNLTKGRSTDAAEIQAQLNSQAIRGKTESVYDLIFDQRYATEHMRATGPGGDFNRVMRGREALHRKNIHQVIANAGIADEVAKSIFLQAGSDGLQEFASESDISRMLQGPDADRVTSSDNLSDRQMQRVREATMAALIQKQQTVNLKNLENVGRHKDNPMWVKSAD